MPLPAQISPTQSNIQAALRAFLQAALPGIPGQQPAVFLGSISGTTLTVSALPSAPNGGIQGAIELNAPVLGLGVTPGTTIAAFLTGSGGVGTYQVNLGQNVAATMSTGVTVVQGQPNRAVEPTNPYFVVVTPALFPRLSTNLDTPADVKFTGSIAGSTLTVSAVQRGKLSVGATIFGVGVASGTVITALGTGTGGTGTYSVSGNQTLTSQTMSAGAEVLTANFEALVQLDFHAPDSLGGDFAQTTSLLLRDDYGVTFFSNLAAPLNGVTPLYADDPKQIPFINAENQYEWRWVLDCRVQVNQTAAVPQEFADQVIIGRVAVDAFYLP